MQPVSAPTSPPTTETLVVSPTPESPETPTHTEAAEPAESIGKPPDEESLLQVVYVKDGNVWYWSLGGFPVALTSLGNVTHLTISDDGRTAAFERQLDEYHSELWAVNTDGSKERLLVSASDFDTFEPEQRSDSSISLLPYRLGWAPGTHILAYNTRETFDGPGLVLFNDLRLVNTDTLEKSILLPAGQGGEFYYSPDGTLMAIITPTSIDLMSLDGIDRWRALVYQAVFTYSEYMYYARPVWAADSSMLRVAIPPVESLAIPTPPTSVWTIPINGSPGSLTASIFAAPFFGSEVAISPNLARIAFMREVAPVEENQRQLYFANIDGSEEILFLEERFLTFAGWAPDSTRFVFAYGKPPQYYLGQVGVESTPLPNKQDIMNLRWVDSERFLYLKGVSTGWELRLGAVTGDSILIDSIAGVPPDFDFKFP